MNLKFRLEVRINCFKCCYWTYEQDAPHSTVVCWGSCMHPRPVNSALYHTKSGVRMVAGHSTSCNSFQARRKILL